jgi:multiple antibiotic resistance protein
LYSFAAKFIAMKFSLVEIASVSLILFSVIDMIGNVPVIVDLRKKTGKIQSLKATIVAGVLMIAFLFLGSSILGLFGIDVNSFAVAGAIIMFIIALEMILGITLFHHDTTESGGASIVPIAFPLIAGAGTLTTIISLKAVYESNNILIGIIVNLAFVYLVLKAANWLEKKIGPSGFSVLRRVFGIIVLSIAVKLFTDNIG